MHSLPIAVCRAEEIIVTTDEDVTARIMQITNGKGAWASINPIGGKASRYLPSCKCCVNRCNSFMAAFFTSPPQCACLLCHCSLTADPIWCCWYPCKRVMHVCSCCKLHLSFAGTCQGGKVHVFTLFKEEVIVPMYDLHFRQIQIQGFWLTQASSF